jgi:hypothetical protein
LGTELKFNSAYHPQSNGKTKRTSQILEDMLHMYIMNKPSKWEEYLHLVEFTYNNFYQTYLKMSPFKALYGIRCNTHVSWDNPVNRITLGPEMLKEMEQEVIKIKQNLKTTQDKHKSYTKRNRTHKEFKVASMCILK